MNNGGEKPTFTPRSLKRQPTGNSFQTFKPKPLGTPTFVPRSLKSAPTSAPRGHPRFLSPPTGSQSKNYRAKNNNYVASQVTRQAPSFTPRPINASVGASFKPRPLNNAISTPNADSTLAAPASTHPPISFVQQHSISQPVSQQSLPAFSMQNRGAPATQPEAPIAFSHQNRPSQSQQRFKPKPLHRASNFKRQRLNSPKSSAAPRFTPRPLASSAGNASKTPVFKPHNISNPSTAPIFTPRPVTTPNFKPSQNANPSRPFRPKPIPPPPRNFNPRPLNPKSRTPSFTQPLPTATTSNVDPLFTPKPLPIPKSSNTGSVPISSGIRSVVKNNPPTSFTPRPLSTVPSTTSTVVPAIPAAPFGMSNMSLIRPRVGAPMKLPTTSQVAATTTNSKNPIFKPKPLMQPRPSVSNSFAVPAATSTLYMTATSTACMARSVSPNPPKPPQLPKPRGPGIPGAAMTAPPRTSIRKRLSDLLKARKQVLQRNRAQQKLETLKQEAEKFRKQMYVLDNYNPTFPAEAINYYMRRGGCISRDPAIAKFISLAVHHLVVTSLKRRKRL